MIKLMKLKLVAFHVMLFLLPSSQAQTSVLSTGEVSIVEGSTSVLSVSKTEIPNLSSTLFTGITITAAGPQPTSIIFVTGSKSNASPTAAVNGAVDSSSELTSAQLGGIIGGCTGALILIIVSLVLLCLRRRNRRKEEFVAGIGVSSYNVQEPSPPAKTVEKRPSNKQANYDNGAYIKKYNVPSENTNDNQDSTLVPPVILFQEDDGRAQQQRLQRNLSMASSNGARLSKYNFLSQAFTQMRDSYADHPNNKNEEVMMHSTAGKF